MKLSTILTTTWLSEREAKLYLSCLKFGSCPASRVANDVGENRTTVYHALLDLCKQWIASKMTKNDSSYFSVISPDELVARYEENVISLKKKLPELYSLYEAYDMKSKVKFYEWLEAVKHMYLDKLNHWRDVYVFLGMNGINSHLKSFMYEEYLEKKLKQNVTSHVILKQTKENKSFTDGDHKENRKSLIIDSPLLNLDCEIDMYGENIVAIITWSDKMVSWIIIENQNIHDALKSFFDLIWEKYSW